MLGSFAGTQSNEVETQHTSAYASIRQHYISIRQLYDRAPSAPASRATFGLAVIAFANERLQLTKSSTPYRPKSR
jgi:hypothetical protein